VCSSDLTLENFAMWKYGTVFFYYDINDPFSGPEKAGSNQFFGGISPTFSLSKMTGKNVSYGIVKDVSLRLEVENGSANGTYRFRNYFYGVQADLSVPGFDFVSINVVARDNPEHAGVGAQYGGFWQMSWDYGQYSKFKFTGFFAWAPHNGDQPASAPFENKGSFFMSQPQLLYDLGNTWGEPNAVEVGIEYLYAINRFQIAGKDEKSVQAILKMNF
jgi:nucleoside-specific outer membrane channel protein Tsx